MIVSLNLDSTKAIYEQLKEQIMKQILSGILEEGIQLPSVRQLASDLGINMHTVSKVYNLLEKEGFLTINKKRGAFVHMDLEKMALSYKSDDLLEEITLRAMIYSKICKDQVSLEGIIKNGGFN